VAVGSSETVVVVVMDQLPCRDRGLWRSAYLERAANDFSPLVAYRIFDTLKEALLAACFVNPVVFFKDACCLQDSSLRFGDGLVDIHDERQSKCIDDLFEPILDAALHYQVRKPKLFDGAEEQIVREAPERLRHGAVTVRMLLGARKMWKALLGLGIADMAVVVVVVFATAQVSTTPWLITLLATGGLLLTLAVYAERRRNAAAP